MRALKNRQTPKGAQKPKSLMSRRMVFTVVLGGIGGAFLIGGAKKIVSRSVQTVDASNVDESKKVTLYKDPQCGCCEGYADYLRKAGFAVQVVPTHDLPLLDEKYGIPTELSPCHISLVDGYVVGGHVPIEIVNKLLTERPKIVGITLPGMPQGSPGMTGDKIAPFEIFEITKTRPYKVYAVV
jgi:hypothetical protein